MEVVDTTQINSLPSHLAQAHAPPEDEPVFILTAIQLQDIITQAIQPLQDEVAQLRATLDRQDEKIAALEQSQDTLSTNQLIQLRLFNGLKEEIHEKSGPTATATETDRIGRIEKLCQDAPGHTISLSELRGRLGIDKSVLSRLLQKIDQDRFYFRKSSTDKRIRYLCQRPEAR
jgi:hypothetical protein